MLLSSVHPICPSWFLSICSMIPLTQLPRVIMLPMPASFRSFESSSADTFPSAPA